MVKVFKIGDQPLTISTVNKIIKEDLSISLSVSAKKKIKILVNI